MFILCFIKEIIMKKVFAAVMALAFVLSAGAAFAAKCTVDSVDGNKITVTCDKADGMKAGDEVTVKAKKGKALEGC
jgi:hypothetical protein